MLAFRIVADGFTAIHEHRYALFKALWIPVLCSTGIDLAMTLSNSTALAWLGALASAAIYAICAISIHRILILGDEYAPAWRAEGWTQRETIFLVAMIVMPVIASFATSIAHYAAAAIGSLAVIAIVSLTTIALLFLGTRLLLIFPMIALGEEPILSEAWRRSSKHPLAIPIAIILAIVISSIPNWVLRNFPGGEYVSMMINEIIFIIDVAVLSMARRLVMQDELPTAPE